MEHSKKLEVLCECKNVEAAGQFICSVQPRNGYYHWLIEKDGKTFGGRSLTQQQAILETLNVIKTK